MNDYILEVISSNKFKNLKSHQLVNIIDDHLDFMDRDSYKTIALQPGRYMLDLNLLEQATERLHVII